MTGESYLYLKIMTAHWQKWGARGGNYETGVYPREGSGVGPGGRALVPTLPLSSSLPRRKSFSSLDPGLFIWEMRQLFSVGNLLPSACDMIHENDRSLIGWEMKLIRAKPIGPPSQIFAVRIIHWGYELVGWIWVWRLEAILNTTETDRKRALHISWASVPRIS